MTAKRWTLLAAVLGSTIVGLDSTIVGVALPRIGQELPTARLGVLEAQAYVYNAYLLAMNALLILGGALGDYYGRRRIFRIGLIAFGAASLACGLAPTMETLVLFRLIQGAAGALLVPGALALIRAAFPGDEAGRAYGVWAGASAGATILAPFLGGLAVDTLSWRVAFLANVPVVLVALWVVQRHVRESRDSAASGAFHWAGAALVALGVGGLAFGPIYGQQRDWHAPLAFVALAVGGAATLALPWAMARAKHPLVPLSLFRSRNFTVTNLSTL
ncbi:MAG TPA: MFS transporter, partial [Chloroflexota bacterium]|nr:MFS transporter [Chloroflexota bacterium]